MVAGFTAPSHKHSMRDKGYSWFFRNQSRLFALDITCMTMLFFLHLFTSNFQIFTEQTVGIVQVITVVLVAFIALSVVWKGIVPIIICIIGIVLMHNSVILPYYPMPGADQINLTTKFVAINSQHSTDAISIASNMNFLLGTMMVALSIIIAYKPSLLFTRNRPDSLESEWSKYPIWHDNTLLAGGRKERSVPLKSLMNPQDRYLLWRYEYVLANICGTPHLVSPEGIVPKDSIVFRDKDSGSIVGKARYTGFFI